MRHYIIYFFASVLLLFQCSPAPLDIEIPAEDPEIVVFSQLIPEALMTVVLTRTINSLEFSEENGDTINNGLINQLLVSDAEVSVAYAGRVDTLFELTDGVYASLFPLQIENEVYTLNIEADGKTITSRNVMLPQVRFESITPKIEETENDTLVTLDYSIVDFPEDNWYMLNFYKQASDRDTTTTIDLNSFFERGTNIETRTVLLSDQLFEDPTYMDNIELPEISRTDSLVVTISNINEEYYNFLNLRMQSGNFFTELTKEPINYPTNIENGLGFFNTHFPDIEIFDLNEF